MKLFNRVVEVRERSCFIDRGGSGNGIVQPIGEGVYRVKLGAGNAIGKPTGEAVSLVYS